MSAWVDPQTWYANLPAFHAAVAALITNNAGDVLLVKPTYRDHWSFPGGYLDADEFPREGCARELAEELGLAVDVGSLLVVDWAPAAGTRPRALMSFTFDCGTVPDTNGVRLAADELESCAFMTPSQAQARLPHNVASRIEASLRARRTASTVYLQAGRYVW